MADTSDNNTSSANAVSTIDVRKEMTAEELEKVDKLRALIFSAPDASFSDEIVAWCDDACLRRYLRARSWDLRKAEAMLRASIAWREETKPHLIQQHEIQGLIDIGTMYMNGFDKQGRPVVYMKPGAANPFPAETRVKYVIWMVECCVAAAKKKSEELGKSVEKFTWVLDFAEFGNRVRSSENNQVAKDTVNILQNQYPERLGLFMLINPPWYFNVLYKIVRPFIAAETANKVRFVYANGEDLTRELLKEIDIEELEECYGGKRPSVTGSRTQQQSQT